ncbi:DNA mismatch repair protein MutS [Thermoclostridium stercorarium subsp. stercorarium DSM 8532]|uniref:DNA mismatch repair protein MutS n=3 Tax=Thermoclostridium stercorarium TaxID=1510 RepID=L7VII7_THES1|nr:DNA mismatch repair protein MutS [Thermoclostridium stercorarium]AGC67875.1 DNA mismatch repair protein MutS [Thermoclostridium stercorarium subsp. stercorarium DSM 8532]AGI38916.1 MutS [Thermoclostridium stercorarium subsp. stercorarium DSM 8532]ANW98285.1 DNA mismatch repair protein MutS [Thermoclostridium stercorarium subsp. thermolacticum DSM 2910]ANX00809.1 DNA mismatch repair protein MutS [Thermoclostridium stercorarium subsp. leptospartum DSM 9219]
MKLTPMMQQYIETKKQYQDCLLFFRLGDFYELFFEDAEIASRELEIALTGRDCGLDERAPMCGVPWHSAHHYIAKLINKGYKVAICEQMEDPALAKGIVKREVTRVITPGTVTDPEMLDEKKNNFLMSVYCSRNYFGIAVADVTTGEFYTTQLIYGNTVNKLFDEIYRYQPSELLVNQQFLKNVPGETLDILKERMGIYITPLDDEYFDRNKALSGIKNYKGCNSIEQDEFALCASGALIGYLKVTQKVDLNHIKEIQKYKIENYMIIDSSSRRNLELTETLRDRKKRGTLLWVLDRTMTAMGGRLLRKWIEQPLLDVDEINRRLDAVEELKDKFMIRSELRELLKKVYDMERLASKLVVGNVNARDLLALKASMGQIPSILDLMSDLKTELCVGIRDEIDHMNDIYELIDKSIAEDPPVTIKDGGIIRDGYSEDVDTYRKAFTEGKQWIADLEAKERELTGIKNLKVRYNKVFGYYIEVTKANLSQVPDRYIRKQTLVNGERFITEELKKLEDTILGAEEKVKNLEYELFCEIREKIAAEVHRIQRTADRLAQLDVLCSLAEVADRENYVKPVVHEGSEIDIKDGRHPVVEKVLGSSPFVPNDAYLNDDTDRVIIITGPNMAGKSTYLRQVALIVLMAQMGSFVPASKATIGIVDRIFTRVGASDDLASGQSTFMVEMTEVANILNNATPRSLLILDEIGRGTSTHDGLAIAWSVIEYINDKSRLGCRTLFATHYHELTELEDKLTGIKNCCIEVKKRGDEIIFLRKIIPGGADQSYGIEVAGLAGVPELVIERAKHILNELDAADINKGGKARKKSTKPVDGQLDLLSAGMLSKTEREVIDEIRALDTNSMTPWDAMNKLYYFQQKLK